MGCIFCDIIDGKILGHMIYEDQNHVSFLDKYPIDHGHSLIIPREHHERITDMDPSRVGDLFSLVPKIANGILKATNATAFSLGQNNGREARQIIPHVHIHIIPRYQNTGTIWNKRVIENDDDLSILAQKIRLAINST